MFSIIIKIILHENENENVNDGNFQRYESIFEAVNSGDLNRVKTLVGGNPEAVKAKCPFSGKTQLHVVVTCGHLDIVEELVKLMNDEDLMIPRKDNYTVLAAAIEIRNESIAKCLIGRNQELLVTKSFNLPVVQAVIFGQQDLAHYLYRVTPPDALTEQENGLYGVELTSACMYRKYFALHRYPLAFAEAFPTFVLDSPCTD
ncbi:hypothetical protein TIFTF001_033129 [Ficus carica]|uniref:Uncharacterized protein n=1 Tax=Ficus carica TaxID=3494 RepID=A0AA88DXW0_FICCA|nr:hypothetical protein TIFTF001_033129 [Ficus carica]